MTAVNADEQREDEREGSEDGPFQATFLLVLPETLPVSHGTTWMSEVGEKEPLLEGLEMRPGPDLLPVPSSGRNYVSLKFWQVPEPARKPNDLEAGAIAASEVLSALTGSEGPTLRDTLTVDMETSDRQQFRTVVEAVTFVANSEGMTASDVRPDPLTRCIDVLLSFHRAYRLHTNRGIRALTYQRLYPLVLWTRRALGRCAKHEVQGVILLNNQNYGDPDFEPLRDQDIRALSQFFVRRRVNDPFVLYAERRLEAAVELHTTGAISKAVVETAIAAEVLFGGVLGLMMWEESLGGDRAEAAVKAFSEDLTKRLRRDYHGRLGGDWSFNSSPIKEWSQRVAAVRHRVVHAGYHPTELEGAEALDALQLLERFIGGRLAENWKRYPRTSWLFLGDDGFERRGRLKGITAWLEENGRDDVEWLRQYGAWREAVDAQVVRQR